MKIVWQLLRATFNEWLEDKAQRLGAALAYYTAFSLAPLLVIAVYVADAFYAHDSLAHIHAQISATLGANAADAIVAAMRALKMSNGGSVATLLSVLTLLLGATAAFGSLQDSMNTIWEVAPKPRPFLKDLLRNRLLSFVMVICLCVWLVISLAAGTLLSSAAHYSEALWAGTALLWKAADFVLSLVLTTLLFGTIYRILPDVRLAWRDVSIGAAATATLFTLGKIPIGLYLAHSTPSSIYGAAGSIMILLAWVYYSAQILFLGAEFTQVYANRFGSRLRPARGAVFLSETARIQQGIPHAETIRQAHRNEQRRRSA